MKHKLMMSGSVVLLCGMMMLLFCTTAYAGCGITHTFIPDAGNTYVREFYDSTEEGDRWVIREYQVCSVCGLRRTVDLLEFGLTVTPHAMRFVKDLGHGVGEHYYQYSCDNCGRSERWVLVCKGPPCVIPMLRTPETEIVEIMSFADVEVE